MAANPYTTLGIIEGTSPEGIKKAYRRLAQMYHPDRNRNPSAEAKFKLIKEAYAFITTGKSATGIFGPVTRTPPPKSKPKPKPSAPRPTPEPWRQPGKTYHGHDAGPQQKASSFEDKQHISGVIVCSFEDLFGGRAIVEGTSVIVDIPYGLNPLVRQRLPGVDSLGHKYICDLEVRVVDKRGFYSMDYGSNNLRCSVRVTLAQLLTRQVIKIRNINPSLPDIEVPLKSEFIKSIESDPKADYSSDFLSPSDRINTHKVKIEQAGLPKPSRHRTDLYVYVEIDFKPIEDETYSTLIALREKIDQTLKSYKHYR